MTLGEVNTRQQLYLKDASLSANVTSWCNDVLKDLANECRWPWLRKKDTATYVVADGYAMLPADLGSIEFMATTTDIEIPKGQPLANMIYGSDTKWSEYGAVAYIPESFEVPPPPTVIRRTVKLTPEPVANYVFAVNYYACPADVSGSTDVIMVPRGAESVFHSMIDCKRLAHEEEVDVMQSRQFQQYQILLKKMRATMFVSAQDNNRARGPFEDYYASVGS